MMIFSIVVFILFFYIFWGHWKRISAILGFNIVLSCVLYGVLWYNFTYTLPRMQIKQGIRSDYITQQGLENFPEENPVLRKRLNFLYALYFKDPQAFKVALSGRTYDEYMRTLKDSSLRTELGYE